MRIKQILIESYGVYPKVEGISFERGTNGIKPEEWVLKVGDWISIEGL